MRTQISDQEVSDASSDALRNSMYFCMPGIVKAFHAGSAGRAPTVDVQPAVHDVRFDLDTGERVSEPWPLLTNVPVAWPKFGGFIISGPLAPGDEVELRSHDLDPSAFRASGTPGDPPDVRRHGGNYWRAVPGGISDAKAPQDGGAAGSELVIGKDGGQPQIRINGSTIQLGASGGDAVGLASKIDQAVSTIVSAFNAHTHSVPSFGAPGTPPLTSAGNPGSITPAPASVASQLVKVQ